MEEENLEVLKSVMWMIAAGASVVFVVSYMILLSQQLPYLKYGEFSTLWNIIYYLNILL